MQPIGVILAGGRSRRMGRDKALVRFRGEPMIDHVSRALVAAGCDVLVVGRESTPSGLDSIVDEPGAAGPAAGVLTALHHSPGRDLFVVAVDQPLIRTATVRHLLAQSGPVVVPMDQGHPQVTCAVYRPECHDTLQALAAAGPTRLRALLTAVATRYVLPEEWASWGEDGRSWRSLDTPKDLAAADAPGLP